MPWQTYTAGGKEQHNYHFIILGSWHSDARTGQGDVENKTACAAIRWPIAITKGSDFGLPSKSGFPVPKLIQIQENHERAGRSHLHVCLSAGVYLRASCICGLSEWGSERFDVKPKLPLLTQAVLRRLQPIEFICVPFSLAGLWSLITSWDKAAKQGSCYFWDFLAMQIVKWIKGRK